MPKKYHSLEEAAQLVGINTDELMKLKDAGDIRGFADRGTWKFREDDLEELKRTRNFDSNPDVPILTDDDLETEEDRSVLAGEEDSLGEMPTVIRGETPNMAEHKSDSDVRLISDDDLTTDGGPVTDDSDSDVQLYDSSPSLVDDDDSDSDVGLMGGTESDLRLIDDDSDSDVQLIESDDDNDATLIGPDDHTDSDVRLIDIDSDSDVTLVPDTGSSTDSSSFESSVFEDEESGVSLGEGSSIKLASESGISLESLDSGIDPDRPDSDLASSGMLDDGDDSGLTLDVDDSGIALEGWDDSGITLENDDDDAFVLGDDDDSSFAGPADSGIALESLEDSGIGLESGSVDMGRTVPMMDANDDLDRDDTAMEVPVLGGESEYELATTGSDDNVLMFDDESDFNEDEATVLRKEAKSSEEFDLTGGDDFDMEDDFDDDFGSEDELATAADEDEDEFATADMGFEEADDLDAFGDDEYDEFDNEYDEGESHADFSPGVAGGGQQMVVAAPEAEWGGGAFAGLAISTLLMAVCAMMMFDLVRSMWSWQDPSGFNSTLLGIVKDMIK
ncbi:helix-turn-helix domain-containing protein [Thalassoroseus pseudoceratinae]|uniref:helix-turn-helix domain-containing protein n=1 Tax=Thalassoroseus pseudoceratinae TaxID=2713176 RepID=UPI0014200225|nr:helix-turn-helix domain-containing protein [Thalassoroseus pseudoceratinae]